MSETNNPTPDDTSSTDTSADDAKEALAAEVPKEEKAPQSATTSVDMETRGRAQR